MAHTFLIYVHIPTDRFTDGASWTTTLDMFKVLLIGIAHSLCTKTDRVTKTVTRSLCGEPKDFYFGSGHVRYLKISRDI